MKHLALGLLLFLLAGAAAAHADGAAAPTGRWLTASRSLEIEIAPCGKALCGTVVRVLSDKPMSPDAAAPAEKPAAPALGLEVLRDFVPDGAGRWSGRIYDRFNGKTYDCLMTIAAADRLQVRPYLVLPLFGKTQIWTRLAEPVRR